MPDTPAPRRRRPRPTEMRRAGLDGIGEQLGKHLPPPIPPGLGEGLLDRARETGSMHNPQLEGLIGRLLERCEMNGKQLDDMKQKVDRIDDRLDGVAYRRDIESFMARDDIERRIEKAADSAKADAKEAVAGVRKDVEKLQGLVKWVGGGLVASFAGLLLKLVLASAHITS